MKSSKFRKINVKNLINLDVGIWEYQVPATNKYTHDVSNGIKTILTFLPCQKHISLFPIAHSIFPSSWLNIVLAKKERKGHNKSFMLCKYGIGFD